MFVSRRIIRPEVGKTELAHERVHRLASLIGGHDVGTRVSKVMAGEGAGDLHLYVYFETMSQAMAVGEAMTADAGVKALMAEREANPAGEVIGPEGFRIISGETKGETRASLQRVYEMKRSNLPAAMEMLDELRVMMKDEPVNIFAGVPVIASKMDMLFVSYAFADLAALGAGVDGVGISPEFQAIVARASEIGRLCEARITVAID